ncbi:MAG: hypothetical protein PHY72_04145, partial [Candidatus Pacebacteria bacterium]|nr:hypothetical protein [Candidatus Paceibacterota bacterium]
LRWKKTGPPASLREPVEDPTFLAGEALRAGERELLTRLDKLLNTLSNINEPDWTKEKLNEIIMPIANELGDRGKILWPMRVALSGKKASAGPFEIAEVLGKEKTLKRIKEARNKI